MNYQIPRLLFSPIAQGKELPFQELHRHYAVFESHSQHIKITICASWLNEYSSPRRQLYSWTYHVHIENHNDSPIHILQKKWDVTKSNGQVTSIQAKLIEDGDVNLGPYEACDYTNCITLDTPSNFVTGYFSIATTNGHVSNIRIPSFSLDNPYDFYPIN